MVIDVHCTADVGGHLNMHRLFYGVSNRLKNTSEILIMFFSSAIRTDTARFSETMASTNQSTL
jgi:hypothetical protein